MRLLTNSLGLTHSFTLNFTDSLGHLTSAMFNYWCIRSRINSKIHTFKQPQIHSRIRPLSSSPTHPSIPCQIHSSEFPTLLPTFAHSVIHKPIAHSFTHSKFRFHRLVVHCALPLSVSGHLHTDVHDGCYCLPRIWHICIVIQVLIFHDYMSIFFIDTIGFYHIVDWNALKLSKP